MALRSTRLDRRCVAALLCLAATPALAQAPAPDGENGRYALQAVAGGFLRLDTRSGTVSTCTDKGSGWACYAVPDERAALDAEIGRLTADNERLKTQLAQADPGVGKKIEEALPKQDSLRAPELKSSNGERKLEIPLPSDRDLDRVMSFVESAWRRLVDLADRMQKDASGKI